MRTVRKRVQRHVDSVIELQPLLTRVEVEQVIQAVIESMRARGENERFIRTGTDFSGRQWYRGRLSRESLGFIAREFFSVQAVHRPLSTGINLASSAKRARGAVSAPAAPHIDPALLPVVAVVDVGVPSGHAQLAPFRRGQYVSPDVPAGLVTDHGSLVASRVVFGDPNFDGGVGQAVPECAFVDANVAADARTVDDKAIMAALQAVVATYPDVRVFNLSLGEYAPLAAHLPVERREKLLLLQDLDNFAFRSDVIVVVAAGNSSPGVVPAKPYPDHIDDPQWALGSWACGFNTLTCGSFVGRLRPGGIVANLGWPSPFTRIGPGLGGSPVPDFAANGGNSTPNYQGSPGQGVWAISRTGHWEDRSGTSFAAPLLAREAAFVFAELDRRCEQGARPFAATVKAFLSLTATPPTTGVAKNVQALIGRTLGRGMGECRRLRSPGASSAVLLWQGVLAGPEDKARIQVPIPRAWQRKASAPCLRVMIRWEAPANAAAEHIWASRKVDCQLRTSASAKAISPHGRNHKSYPALDRLYRLDSESLGNAGIPVPDDDSWVLDVSYEEIADYTATIEFSPHQRVGIAMELFDDSAVPESPQRAMQALPSVQTMTRLTVPENRIANPIVVRPRV